jgi:hypothetical protein
MGEPQPGEERVDALARAVLGYQARENPVYGALVRGRGVDPETASHWMEFPPVPVRGFRGTPPFIGAPGEVAAAFRTSGTTGGEEHRGTHWVRDLDLYATSLLTNGERFLNPGGEVLRMVSLLPDPLERPDSSLVHMAGVFHAAWGDGGGGFFADPEWRLDVPGFERALRGAETEGAPVLVMATAFALVHWMDGSSARFSLPPGSRVLETGGFKGRSRVVERGAFYQSIADRLGLGVGRIVNEYGMTEMLSQFWEPVLLESGGEDPVGRRLVAPPWVRTRILDPVSLEPVPEGTPGLLCHLDLANLDSAALLLTEDLGVRVASPAGGVGEGFRVLGRTPGAPPRGCSLAMEAWMEASR